MNNEFLWRNQMRKLAEPAEPAHELWPAIAARLEAAPYVARAGTRRSRGGWIAIAAILVVACATGLVAHRWQTPAPVAPTAMVAPSPAQPPPNSNVEINQLPGTALGWAQPEDPGLAATAQNLDIATAQLQDALEQRPDAVFLVGLLNHTNAMRLRLLRTAPNAG